MKRSSLILRNHRAGPGGHARRIIVVAMVAAAAAAGPAGPVAAATIELASGNSSAMVETDTGLGLWSWMVDGVEHAGQVWSWYRLDGDRLPVNLLPEVSVDAGADWMPAVQAAWTDADQALWAGVLNFWFLGRVFDRVRP